MDEVAMTADLGGSGIELRAAGADDADVIRRILAMAMSWRTNQTPVELPPQVASYHQGWPRPDDLGMLAFRGIEFAGGAYVRRVGPADGTYGYVSSEFAELTVGIEPAFRRQGLARLCLESVKAAVIQRGIAGISLSVESDNFARNLYVASGFELVEDRGGDWLMLWRSPVGSQPVD